MDGKYSGNNFLLGFSSVANHGGYVSWFFLNYVLTYLQANGLWVGNQNKPFSMYKPSTYLAIIFYGNFNTELIILIVGLYVRDPLLKEWVRKLKPYIN
jgi:hypothetical protein